MFNTNLVIKVEFANISTYKIELLKYIKEQLTLNSEKFLENKTRKMLMDFYRKY